VAAPSAPYPPGRGAPGNPRQPGGRPPVPRRLAGPPTAARPPGRAPDDRPTDVLPPVRSEPPVEDAEPEAESPPADRGPRPVGRRRRQLGGSPDERPASTYRPPTSNGRAARPGRRRRPTFWRELPILVVVALVLTFLIQTFLAKVYVIPSGSMETTLHGCNGCVNDRVLVDKVIYQFRDPRPGDVVVFRGPDTWRNSEFTVEETANPLLRGLQALGSLVGLAPPDEKDFVKRVIAVGGQTVQCCDSRNRVLVDGEPLNEPYIYYLPEAGPARQNAFGPVTVPNGQLWMMGDSRNNSADSRVADHGPVPVDNVIGKARLIVLPFTRFGTIHAIDPQSKAVGLPALDPNGSGNDGGAPLALGLLGALPIAAGRRRVRRREADLDAFLPTLSCDPFRYRS
jgi:signal peptidase I